MIFPRPREDDIIEPIHITSLQDAMQDGPPVVAPLLKTLDGAIYSGEQPGIWITLTGPPTGLQHPWQAILPVPGGNWTNGPSNNSGSPGSDPAYEINGNTADLTGMRAKAWRDKTSNEMRFAYSACP